MEKTEINRRSFIRTGAIGGLATLSLSSIVTSLSAADKPKKLALNKNDIILFQGDSITDASRDKTLSLYNDVRSLGTGYAFISASDLLYANPGKSLRIYNKGISGNKVYQLAERWDTDTLSLNPAVLSILVGVNDYWHISKHNYSGTIRNYRDDYKKLLQTTKDKFPDIKVIIGEPFALLGGSVGKNWFPAFHEYRYVARELAESFSASFISFQSIFDEALKAAPWNYWTVDGVHPSIAGSKLMSLGWLDAIKK